MGRQQSVYSVVMHILVKSQDEIKKAPINQENVHMDSLLQILRPPHRVKKAYQLSPIRGLPGRGPKSLKARNM